MELDPDQQAFVDATMAPLGENVGRRELLATTLGQAATYPTRGGDDVSIATERMRKTASSFKIRNTLVMGLSLLIVAIAAWAAVIGPPALVSMQRIVLSNRVMSLMGSVCCAYPTVPPLPFWGTKQLGLEDDPLTRMISERASEKDRRLMLGDLKEAFPVPRWKKVWDEYPDDPRHYFAYAAAFQKQHARWPDDFVKTGERLDPGNGWFRLLEGAAKVRASIGRSKSSAGSVGKPTRGKVPGPKTLKPLEPEEVILDPTLCEEGMNLMEEALAMPRLDDYRKALKEVRFGATPPVIDLADLYAASISVWLQPEHVETGWVTLRSYSEAFSLAAADAAKRGDRRELERVRVRSTRLSERLVEVSSSLLSKLMAKAILIRPAKSLAQAWAAVGEPEKGKEFEFIVWNYDPKTTPIPAPVPPKDALAENRGSGVLVETYMGSQRVGSTPVTEPELRGGRLAEYAMYERLMLHAAAIVLFLAILYLGISCAISRRKFGLLPDRLMDLLRFGDHLWIFLLGIALPFSLYALATRSSWLAPREFALSQDRFFMWLIQALTLAALVILGCLQAICWRLKRRGSILVLGGSGLNPSTWLSATAAAAMIAGPRLLDATPHDTLVWKFLWASLAMIAGLAWLWILTLVSGQLASRERKLHRATLRRGMIPYLALALGLAALPIPMIQTEERHWVSRIDFEALRPGNNMFEPRTEAEHADWIGQQVRRALSEVKLIPHE